MKHRTVSLIFTNSVVALAVLIAAYTGNPWAACVLATLFVFVIFPRWRSKVYRLLDKLLSKLARRGNDSCIPPHA
jgi:hypothetical protein